jgi:hypothetical protein
MLLNLFLAILLNHVDAIEKEKIDEALKEVRAKKKQMATNSD